MFILKLRTAIPVIVFVTNQPILAIEKCALGGGMAEYRSVYTRSLALLIGINTYADPRFVPLGQAEAPRGFVRAPKPETAARAVYDSASPRSRAAPRRDTWLTRITGTP